MKDAARFLAAAGLFMDERQASGTFYATVSRLVGEEFEKAGRGVYSRRTFEASPGTALATKQTIPNPPRGLAQLPEMIPSPSPGGPVPHDPFLTAMQAEGPPEREGEENDLDAEDLPF